MKKNILVTTLFACAACSSLSYAQTHNHGHGELVVAQDGKIWQMQFTLPAADIFGFEHEPEDEQQHEQVEQQVEKLEQPNNIVLIPKGCTLLDKEVEVPFEEHEEEHHHDDEDEHHDEDHHDDGHHDDGHHDDEHESHSDVEITLSMTCDTAIKQLAVNIFGVSASLEEIDASWAIDKGQGNKELSQADPVIRF